MGPLQRKEKVGSTAAKKEMRRKEETNEEECILGEKFIATCGIAVALLWQSILDSIDDVKIVTRTQAE